MCMCMYVMLRVLVNVSVEQHVHDTILGNR
jgi:hypothetical protein